MTFIAIVLVCTMIESKPIEQQRCLEMSDSLGPYTTMDACQARVKAMATNRDVIGAAGFLLATSLNYKGSVSVRGGCVKGISA